MAPRWIMTNEASSVPLPPHAGENDWLLVSGAWKVGRVLPVTSGPHKDQFSWSLYGPHTPQAGVQTSGTETGIEAAKAALLASWRAWQVWAGMRDEAPPPLPPEARPQDPHLDGRDLKFEALEHGGAEPDTMPQAIRITDPQGRTAVYVLDERRVSET